MYNHIFILHKYRNTHSNKHIHKHTHIIQKYPYTKNTHIYIYERHICGMCYTAIRSLALLNSRFGGTTKRRIGLPTWYAIRYCDLPGGRQGGQGNVSSLLSRVLRIYAFISCLFGPRLFRFVFAFCYVLFCFSRSVAASCQPHQRLPKNPAATLYNTNTAKNGGSVPYSKTRKNPGYVEGPRKKENTSSVKVSTPTTSSCRG